MAQTIKSSTKVVNAMKRVKEEIIRYEWDNVTNNIAIGTEVELYLNGGSRGNTHDVKIGECEELLSLGINPSTTAALTSFIDQLRVTDRDGSEWNKFLTINHQIRMNANQLMINDALNFERQMMGWGYRSFLSSPLDLSSTLKLPEGDQLKLFIRSNAASAGALIAGRNKTFATVRRYLPGSNVDYKHFNNTDGGLKSNKRYYNDVQFLGTTVVNQYVLGWQLQVLRNEAYKFFEGGVLPDVDLTAPALASHLMDAKIMIDNPMTQYNEYFVNHNYNMLPFTSSNVIAALPSATVSWWPVDKRKRFSPTIDIVKNRNKDLSVFLRDDGNVCTNLYTVMTGIKYQM